MAICSVATEGATATRDDDTKMELMKIGEKIIDICQYKSKIMLIGEKKPLLFSEIIDSLKEIILKIFDKQPEKFVEYYSCMLRHIWYSYLDEDIKETDIITKIAICVSYQKVMKKFTSCAYDLRKTIKNNTKKIKTEQINMLKNWKYLIAKQKALIFTMECIKGLTTELINHYS